MTAQTAKHVKPHLACDWDATKVQLPVIVLAKIDGVRGINLTGAITGRSLKAFKNNFIAECYSHETFYGVDGELALGDWCSPTLCSDTTGFVNRKTAKPGKPTKSTDLNWYAFDYLHHAVIDLPYIERLEALARAHATWFDDGQTPNVHLVPWKLVHSVEEILEFEEKCLDAGFEGVIGRDPQGLHKSGRATVKGGAYWRIKRFIDFEGTIEEIIEAKENTNEAKTNELGRTERSTHQENMVPKGMVGMIRMRALQDVLSDSGEVLIAKGQLVDVGPGKMLHEDRVRFFENPSLLLGKIGKAKFFPKGHKDKPRFPTFISLRAEEDMSED